MFEGHTSSVTTLAVLPDGRIASGSSDNTVRLWDPGGRVAPLVLEGHDDSVTTLAVVPDGWIASGSDDNTVRVWDPSGALVAVFAADAQITCLGAAADRMIVAGDSSGAVHFLELR